MKRARRITQRLIRWTSLCACFSIILSSLVLFPVGISTGRALRTQEQSGRGNDKARKVPAQPPQPGPPKGILPNIDEAKREVSRPAKAPDAIPSTGRRRRRGHRQGARLTLGQNNQSLLASAGLSRKRELKADASSNLRRDNDSQPLSDSSAKLFSGTTSTTEPLPQDLSNFAMARLAAGNRTGTGGEDLLSNNFNWSLPLVGLKGRGLDLGLSLSYNSLVWTRSGNEFDYDMDDGSIAPGFRLGFPTVEGPYWNDQAGTYFYLLVMPSGARVELRYTGSGNVYESKDSAHLQLIDNGSSLLVRPTDGTELSFVSVDSSWRCNQIKDRNGNYLTVTYKSWGEIETITDTVGRVLTFNYDGYQNLLSITQTWNGQTHYWATFGWGTAPIGNNFAGFTNWGPNSTSVTVLTQVGLADGSRYNFEYDSSYGMVSTIRHYAADNHQRRYTAYLAPASLDLVPRLTQRRDWAENWNGINGVPSEVVASFTHDGDGACKMTAPDGTIYKEYYGASWQNGLTTQSEVWSGGVKQKWTTVAWTQDNTSVSYLTNPRVTETNVYDAQGNRRRQTIEYGPYAQWSLPYLVREYAADGVTQIRHSFTDYNLNQAYLDRRIIGLVSAVHITNTAWYETKIGYAYDESAQIQATSATTIQHDASFGTSFLARGNVTSISRWDITDASTINDANRALFSRVSYDTNGSPVWSKDPLNHQSSISYADSFSDGINSRNTFAYPTTATDADGFSSTVQYNFDFGAVTRTQGPPPAGQSQGAIQTMSYDDAARIQWLNNVNNGAWRFFAYSTHGDAAFSQVTITAGTSSYWTIKVVDGAERTIITGGDNPDSTGGYAAVYTQYDAMGRVSKQSNPAETNGGWAPTGDDAAGWIFTEQTYDWKGRPLETRHLTDETVKYASYGGCGCAGGEVVTLTDEVGRQQKVYSDVLGRQWKTEVLNWNGTVYATTTNSFNARDQVTLVRQWAGSENGGGTYQDTTMSYDGYGRLKTKHVPQQDTGTATIYAYNADDTLQSVTDARGASATYSYNNRHLVTGRSYSAPSGITPTSNVSYGYDAAGNRTSMTDGMGSASYNYNQLSQMTSETRTFTGLGSYTLGYDYNLAGELTSITDPSNATISYGYDFTGRLSSVTGTSFGGVTTYASNPGYRAWGALKSLVYGNSKTLSIDYNNRLMPSSYEVPGVLKKSYQRNADGTVQFTQDQLTTNSKYDRSYTYDHVGRVSTALSGAEARGGGPTNDRPYNETLTYDAFNHLTTLTRKNWDRDDGSGPTTFINNRSQEWGYAYDADGRVVAATSYYGYDAAGRTVAFGDSDPYFTDQVFTGDGQRGKTISRRFDDELNDWVTEKVTYYLTSSVLGGELITELSEQGAKELTLVYAGGRVLASQKITSGVSAVEWEHWDASGASNRPTDATGQWINGKELDALGANAGLGKPFNWNMPSKKGLPVPYPEIADMLTNTGGGCAFRGMPTSCQSPSVDFWGSRIADLPGFGTNWGSFAEQAEQRHLSLMQGFDPAFNRIIGRANVTIGGVIVQSIENPTLDEYQQLLTAYGPDSGFSDQDEHDVSTSYNVTIFGGPDYFGNPQNPRPRGNVVRAESGGKTDCQRFADRVAEIAARHNEVGAFVDELARTFIGVASGDVITMNNNANNRTGEYFSSSGFRGELYDEITDNQARHFMGGLVSGFKSQSVTLARGFMNWNENSQADRRMNEISIPLGRRLTNPQKEQLVDWGDRGGWKRVSADPGFKGLAGGIRAQVCAK